MEDRVLTRNAYSLMFAVLGVWSFIPYLLPSNASLSVFSQLNISLEILFVLAAGIACHGTYQGKKHGYTFGVIVILCTIFYLGYQQLVVKDSNILQLATLVTMMIILAIYAKVFKPVPSTSRRTRLSTIELNLETGC